MLRKMVAGGEGLGVAGRPQLGAVENLAGLLPLGLTGKKSFA